MAVAASQRENLLSVRRLGTGRPTNRRAVIGEKRVGQTIGDSHEPCIVGARSEEAERISIEHGNGSVAKAAQHMADVAAAESARVVQHNARIGIQRGSRQIKAFTRLVGRIEVRVARNKLIAQSE